MSVPCQSFREQALDHFVHSCREARSSVADADLAQDVTILVKTLERPLCIVQLLISLRQFFATLKVIVCDDSRQPLFPHQSQPAPGIFWHVRPFEAGHTVGAGRNLLMDLVETPFFFYTDDDHEFTAHTRIRDMLTFLREYNYDLVGCASDDKDYEPSVFKKKGKILYQYFHAHHGLVAPHVVACDRVSNTFLARTETVRPIRWDERVYRVEHSEYYFRASQQGLRIAQMGCTYMLHSRHRCEPPEGWFDRLFGRFLWHPSRSYRLLCRVGIENPWLGRKHILHLHKKYILDKLGLTKMIQKRSWQRSKALQHLIGRPTDTVGHS